MKQTGSHECDGCGVSKDSRRPRRDISRQGPDAKKVQVDLGKPWDMERDSEGVWSVTIPPQVPGFHYYYLNIDGVRVSDPASQKLLRREPGIERH